MPTVFAQNTAKIDSLIGNLAREIIQPGILLLTAVAVVVFLYGVFEFIRDSSSDEAVTKGKQHMLWGIIGLFIIVSAWGIIAFICNTVDCQGTSSTGISPAETTKQIDICWEGPNGVETCI